MTTAHFHTLTLAAAIRTDRCACGERADLVCTVRNCDHRICSACALEPASREEVASDQRR